MKVVHFYPVWLSQTATWLYYQIKYLPDSVEPHVVCEKTENLEQFSTPNIHSLSQRPFMESILDRGLRKAGIRNYLGLLKRVIRKVNADAVHFHFGPLACCNLAATRGIPLKKFVTFYGLDVNQLPKNDPKILADYQVLFREVDAVFCEGPFMASEICKLGCPAEKIHVHHLGVPLDRLPYRPRQWCSGEPLKLLISSSFVEKKGIPYALQAIGRLVKELPIELTLIGDKPRGSERGSAEKKRILEIIDEFGLKPFTRMAGYVSHQDMIEIAREHHLFVSTSVTAGNGDTEGGSPVAITEMAASGMCIVASRHCDIPNVIVDGETGRLSDEKDVAGIYNDLRWFAGNPKDWRAMQDAGRARIERDFNCVVQGQRLAKLYDQIISSPPNA